MDLTTHIRKWGRTANGCLVVLHTDLAFASIVAQMIDGAAIDGVLGTIAGDDTVFVATDGPAAHAALLEVLGLDGTEPL